MSIRRLDIVSIPVADAERAKAFYRDVLGFDVIRDNPMGPNQQWIELAPPGAETSITLVTWFDSMPAGSVQGLVVDCEDIHATHADLKSRGLTISDIEAQPWGQFANFKDPDGNGWVLQQAQ